MKSKLPHIIILKQTTTETWFINCSCTGTGHEHSSWARVIGLLNDMVREGSLIKTGLGWMTK